MKIDQIRIRDPFILTDKEKGCYYMYGTTDLKEGISAGNCFHVYKSYDLEEFETGKEIFHDDKFGADRDFWAAEVHKYNGKYYLLGSCMAENRCRGTYIFVCDIPDGEFKPVSDNPITPNDWECLDGTLYVEDGTPYIVFCKEWLQIGVGEIYSMKLSCDLSRADAEPRLFFRADESKLCGSFSNDNHEKCCITDAPYFVKGENKLIMTWSTVSIDNKYCVLQATAKNIADKPVHSEDYVFSSDGGHCMLFYDLENNLKIALHQPNIPTQERAKFFDVQIVNDSINLKK